MLLFAVKTLIYDRGKLLIALLGVVFSFVLVNVQTGLLLGLIRKGSILVDHAKADIWVGRRGVENVDFAHEIPETWLHRIRGLPGIENADPYIVNQAVVTLANGEFEEIWIIGFEPASPMGHVWNLSDGNIQDLLHPDCVSIDELDAWKLGNPKIGDLMEINGKRAKIVATTHGVLAFTNAPFLFTNVDTARSYCQMREGTCNYFLIKTSPKANREMLCDRIRQLIPEVDVFIAEDFSRKSQLYWLARTGIGISFGASTVLGLIVGLVMVGQSLYALTLDHIADYAALKAIGAENAHIYRVVLLQSVSISIVGTFVGVVAVLGIQHFFATPVAPIDISVPLLACGIGLNFVMCIFGSVLPFRRIHDIDPAMALA